MTAMQMNAELFRAMGIIAEDEGLMAKLLKYAKRLATKKESETLLTKEEFLRRVEKAEAQIARGEGMEMLPGEDLTAFLNRNGYGI